MSSRNRLFGVVCLEVLRREFHEEFLRLVAEFGDGLGVVSNGEFHDLGFRQSRFLRDLLKEMNRPRRKSEV